MTDIPYDYNEMPLPLARRQIFAEGCGAHGHFQPYHSHHQIKASFLRDSCKLTPLFVRFGMHCEGMLHCMELRFYTDTGMLDIPLYSLAPDIHMDMEECHRWLSALLPNPCDGLAAVGKRCALWQKNTHMAAWMLAYESGKGRCAHYAFFQGSSGFPYGLADEDGKKQWCTIHCRALQSTDSSDFADTPHASQLAHFFRNKRYLQYELILRSWDNEKEEAVGVLTINRLAHQNEECEPFAPSLYHIIDGIHVPDMPLFAFIARLMEKDNANRLHQNASLYTVNQHRPRQLPYQRVIPSTCEHKPLPPLIALQRCYRACSEEERMCFEIRLTKQCQLLSLKECRSFLRFLYEIDSALTKRIYDEIRV